MNENVVFVVGRDGKRYPVDKRGHKWFTSEFNQGDEQFTKAKHNSSMGLEGISDGHNHSAPGMRRLRFDIVSKVFEPSPMPAHIPDVPEVGASSAPLKSAAYFIGARCKPYNDDYLLCKKEDGEFQCLKEGRRVTRCAISVIEDMNKHCYDYFKLHWECLENREHRLSGCRKAETLLNKCVFQNLGLEKKIPGVKEQIHLKTSPIQKFDAEYSPAVAAWEQAKKDGSI
ncbi:hypothetical protein BABINDRAFT_161604 [Babjeviella inositovora NRRL Y-12698]|uniref:NADH-ubiquinone oxidoreductase n=1 Tax=Babjeviella inositovora NRRL Y-12698 TaxID=984486 RepID=A0A1E3QQK9_9ASCO|nr:uncharacterized protein BABINDRAFT_161604 [Babjeviella inositovora NRRL Y-12698]ODQ79940.1 hypothetical protein BABINDRAFT_161604 [Babjeviella inositovora NRRL Y-12698]